MKRWLPSPGLSAALALAWLVLVQAVSVGSVLLAAAVGVLVPLLSARLRPPREPGRPLHPRLRPLPRLCASVAADIARSCAEVAIDTLRSAWRPPRSAFVTVPLDARDPRVLAALAMITTLTPGTVWSELAADRSAVLLHVFDLDGEAAFVAHFKSRYEAPLRQIFE